LIINVQYTFPEGLDQDASDLIRQLLVKDPSKRLGSGQLGKKNDYKALKSHKFFRGIDFDNL